MLKEKQKIVHILDVLLAYALRGSPEKVTITIEDLSDRVQVSIDDIGIKLGDRELQELERCLNTPRRSEMREYYSGLAGDEVLFPNNLRIVGMMVDGGHVVQNESGVHLTVWWKPD